jgi:hypothetical protein
MAWDDDKATADELTSDEWDTHVADQKNHAGRHEQNGSDELDVSGLSGVLADAQTPQTEAVEDIVGGLIQANGNITVNYDDGNNVLTVDTSALNTEEVEDAVASLVTAGNAITVNYDDGADALSIGVDESGLSFYDGTNLTAPVDNASVSTDNATVNNELNVNELISSFDSNHFVEFVERSIDNTNRKSLSDQQSNLSGAAIINDNTNDQTCFVVAKASGGPIIVDQTGSGFTETVGNQGTVNIYNANSTHQLENETGGSVEVNIIAFGVGF